MGKRKKQKSSGNPLQQFALWQWGLLLIVAGPAGAIIAGIVLQAPSVPVTAEQRGQAFGRGLAAVLSIIAGVVLIVLHFVRRKRRR